jgi:hypothetical protein
MMGLVKKEELHPERNVHFPKEGMDPDSACIVIRQPPDEPNDLFSESSEATDHFLNGQTRPFRPG